MSEKHKLVRTGHLNNSAASRMEYCASVKSVSQKHGSIFLLN